MQKKFKKSRVSIIVSLDQREFSVLNLSIIKHFLIIYLFNYYLSSYTNQTLIELDSR